MSLIVLWLIVGIIQLISHLTGNDVSWFQYWCTYTVLILQLVQKYAKERKANGLSRQKYFL